MSEFIDVEVVCPDCQCEETLSVEVDGIDALVDPSTLQVACSECGYVRTQAQVDEEVAKIMNHAAEVGVDAAEDWNDRCYD